MQHRSRPSGDQGSGEGFAKLQWQLGQQYLLKPNGDSVWQIPPPPNAATGRNFSLAPWIEIVYNSFPSLSIKIIFFLSSHFGFLVILP
jgi:hypothetical protein